MTVCHDVDICVVFFNVFPPSRNCPPLHICNFTQTARRSVNGANETRHLGHLVSSVSLCMVEMGQQIALDIFTHIS